MARIPKAAARILDDGVLCYVVVHTSHGPHLTPMVYATHAGRVWITTSRSSVKARAWRTSPEVAGLVRHEGMAVTFRGVVSTYDALDPRSWPGAVLTGPRLARAGAKFSLKNARFFAGYAVDARKVPLSWSPPGRVFAAIRLTAGWVLDEGQGRVVEGWGDWPRTSGVDREKSSPRPASKGRKLRVPEPVRAEVGDGGEGAIALEGSNGELTVLPVTWRRANDDGYEAIAPALLLDLTNATDGAGMALTADRVSTWRAADMAGLLLQGRAQLLPDSDAVLVRLRPNRLVWWRGWTSGTVTPVSGAPS
jgi:hypothetical protein